MMKIEKKINLKKKLQTTRINLSNSQLRVKNYNNIIKIKLKQVIKLNFKKIRMKLKLFFKNKNKTFFLRLLGRKNY